MRTEGARFKNLLYSGHECGQKSSTKLLFVQLFYEAWQSIRNSCNLRN